MCLKGVSIYQSPEDTLFEVELEDMCEEDPNTWESRAYDKSEEYNQLPGETRDSVTGETLDSR